MLCSTVGSGAVGTDNEEQTFAGLGAAAVGGPRLQAITAGEGGGMGRLGLHEQARRWQKREWKKGTKTCN